MFVPNFPSKLAVEIDGKLTMAGVVEKYWSELSKGWIDDTAKKYFDDYCDIIFPHFMDHPLEYYDDIRYFDEAIIAIQEVGTRISRKTNPRKPASYSPSSIQHFRYLSYLTVKIGSAHNVCIDFLWGTNFSYTESKITKLLASKTELPKRLKKSLSSSEEYKISDALFTDYLQPGQYMALLLMWILGLRNSEACAVVFGDILPIIDHPGCFVLAVHCTMERATHYLKGRGKTRSFYRFIPIPPNLYSFLMQRKAYLQAEIDAGRIIIVPSSPIKSIDDLPVACSHHDWLVHCTSNLASNTGRQLFKRIRFDKDSMYYLGEDASHNIWDNEKDATAYTFRRHFCTMLTALGFLPTQIEYLMGHKPFDPSFKRKIYANPDMHAQLYRQMLLRPVVNKINFGPVEVSCESGTTSVSATDLRLQIPCKGQRVTVRITPNEFHFPGKVSLKLIPGDCNQKITVEGTWTQHKTNASYPSEVNVLHYLYEDYRRAEARHMAAKEQASSVADNNDCDPST